MRMSPIGDGERDGRRRGSAPARSRRPTVVGEVVAVWLLPLLGLAVLALVWLV